MPDELNDRDNLDLDFVRDNELWAQRKCDARDVHQQPLSETPAWRLLRICRGWRHLRTAFGATLNQRDEARRGMVRLAFLSSTSIDISGTGLGEPGRYTVSTQFEAAAVWWGIEVATKMFGEPGPNWTPPQSQPMPLAVSEPPTE